MEGLGKDHAHGLPLVFQPRAQPALSPPLGGSRLAFDMQRHVDRKGFPEIYAERQTYVENGLCGGCGGLWWFVVVVVKLMSYLCR